MSRVFFFLSVCSWFYRIVTEVDSLSDVFHFASVRPGHYEGSVHEKFFHTVAVMMIEQLRDNLCM